MKFLVIGCGSIGQKHIRNLKKLGIDVAGCEMNISRANEVKKIYGIKVFGKLQDAFKAECNAAIICTPTSTHVPIAIEAARRKMHILIEKPLSADFKKVDELTELAKKNRLSVLVACNARFLPSLSYVKKMIDNDIIGKILSAKVECGFYLPYWHPESDYRKEYSARQRLGGGVILDDIHEIDSLRWLFGEVKEVFCFADKVSDLEIDTEDIAEIVLKFKKGVVAELHLDYLQKTYRRFYEFIGENGIIILDFIAQSVKIYSAKTDKWTKKVFAKELKTRNEAMFTGELRHFVNCINGREELVNDISSAKKTLEIALACHKSAREKKVVKL